MSNDAVDGTNIYIIVAVRDKHNITNTFIDSLYWTSFDKEHVTLVIVDNSPHDYFMFKDRGQKKSPIILHNSPEKSVTESWNMGLKVAFENKSHYVGVCSNDTALGECVLPIMVRCNQFYGGFVSPYCFGSKTGLELFSKCRDTPLRAIFEFPKYTVPRLGDDGIVGSFIFADTDTFRSVGLFDEQFKLYYQDCDYTQRARQLGIKISEVRNCVYLHFGSVTTMDKYNDNKTKIQQLNDEDRIRYNKKWNLDA